MIILGGKGEESVFTIVVWLSLGRLNPQSLISRLHFAIEIYGETTQSTDCSVIYHRHLLGSLFLNVFHLMKRRKRNDESEREKERKSKRLVEANRRKNTDDSSLEARARLEVESVQRKTERTRTGTSFGLEPSKDNGGWVLFFLPRDDIGGIKPIDFVPIMGEMDPPRSRYFEKITRMVPIGFRLAFSRFPPHKA